jgi:hypothetical protein
MHAIVAHNLSRIILFGTLRTAGSRTAAGLIIISWSCLTTKVGRLQRDYVPIEKAHGRRAWSCFALARTGSYT